MSVRPDERTHDSAVGDDIKYGSGTRFYAMETNTVQWWTRARNIPATEWDR